MFQATALIMSQNQKKKSTQWGGGDNDDTPYTVSNRIGPQTRIRIKGESLKPLGLAKELTPNGTKFDSMHISDMDQSRGRIACNEKDSK